MAEASAQEQVRATEKERFLQRIIVFAGPEGSGKSTQSKLTSEKTHLPLLSTGDLFRSLAENDKGEFGDMCRKMYKEKRYLTALEYRKIIAEELKKDEYKNGFVMDGGIRTSEETEEFENILKDADRLMPVNVIFLRMPGWKSMQRMKERGREDDTFEGSLARLENFYDKLGTRMSFAKKNWNFGQVIVLDKSPEVLNQEIMGKLSE